MTDAEALDFLAYKMGALKNARVAKALGVSPAVLSNWRRRGISPKMRAVVWALVNDHGGNLPRDWLMPKDEAA